MKNLTRAAFAAAAIAMFSTAAFASPTTVNVMLMGEGGSAMKIEVDKTSIPGGDVVFNVANHAMTEAHEMILVKLKSAGQHIPLDMKKHRVDEKQIKALGEVADLQPAGTGSLKANLQPGAYLILCNIKGHYEAGMWTKLTVSN